MYKYNFAPVQMALNLGFIQRSSKGPLPVTMFYQEFPYPPHSDNSGFNDIIMTIMPASTMFSFVFMLQAVLKRIVEEKVTGIKVPRLKFAFKLRLLVWGVFCFCRS